jgi:hypothetical protein
MAWRVMIPKKISRKLLARHQMRLVDYGVEHGVPAFRPWPVRGVTSVHGPTV